MEYDLKIANAMIVDGCGTPRFSGAVGVKDGRIVAVGEAGGTARETIDAGGKVVSPGFIDCHTHYDAQVCWDPMLSPSVYHGVTTVLAGNCGFTLAPLSGRAEDTDYLIAMLSRVEGMPLPALQAALKPTWRSFGEYLDAIDGNVAINMAFLVGHCALRRAVMGERAVGHEASEAEIAAMAALLRQAIEEGGCGFSTTASQTHSDHTGQAVPSRWASDAEIMALAAVVKDYPGTWLELAPPMSHDDPQRRLDMVTQFSLAGQRPVNWNSIIVRAQSRELLDSQMRVGRYAAERGAKVLGLVPAVPIRNVINFRTGIQIDLYKGWHDFIHLEHDAKIAAMRDPEVRRRLREGAEENYFATGLPQDFGEFRVIHLPSQANAHLIDKTFAEIGAMQGKHPFDALFDLALEENLELSISAPGLGDDPESWELRGQVWRDPYCLIGASDAGAHLDALNTFAIATQVLGESVRRRGIFDLEEGVQRITSMLADAFGLKDRGRIAVGAAADLVVFDPETIDCGPIDMRHDLPGGEVRLYADAVGVHHVIVGGVPVAADNQPTGRLGGRTLRSGRDTVTVPLT